MPTASDPTPAAKPTSVCAGALADQAPPGLWRLVIPTLGGATLAAALSATATPDERRFDWLIGLGLDAGTAGGLLHVLPVIVTALLIPTVAIVMRAKPIGHRMSGYAMAGMILGGVTALCLNLFDGFIPLLERLLGPMPAPGFWDRIAWILTVMCAFQAIFMGVLALFGRPALKVLSPEKVSMEVRYGDRTMFGWSAIGMLGQACVAGALAALNQALNPTLAASLVMAGVIALGAGLYGLSSWRLWVRYDELFRRIVVEAMALSATAVTIIALVWAVAEGAGLSQPLSAYGLCLILLASQAAAVIILSLRMNLWGAN